MLMPNLATAKKEVKQAEVNSQKSWDKFNENKKQFGIGDSRTVRAAEAMESSIDDLKGRKKNLSKVDTESRKQMLGILSVSNPASTKIAEDSSKATKTKRKEWQNTMDDVNKLVSADVTTPGHEVKFTAQGKKVRAHALPPGDEIVIRIDQQSRVIAHEVAHTIEMKNPRILQRAEDWRDNRTKGEREQLLSKITGNKNYGKDEKTKPDKFIHPYIGKPYKNATEVISMWLERMLDDPVKFAKDDADMFDFVYAALRSG